MAAAEEPAAELNQRPWEYSLVDAADMPEPLEWMLGHGQPHLASWRAGRDLYKALAKAAGIKIDTT